MTTPPSQTQGEMPGEIFAIETSTMRVWSPGVSSYGGYTRYIRADLAESRVIRPDNNEDPMQCLKALSSFVGPDDDLGRYWIDTIQAALIEWSEIRTLPPSERNGDE